MNDYLIYKERRKRLYDHIEQNNTKQSYIVMLFATYESERFIYYPESSFYYLTGITEPGAVFVRQCDGKEVVYLPNFGGRREQWVNVMISTDKQRCVQDAHKIQVDDIRLLGKEHPGYTLASSNCDAHYAYLLNDINQQHIDTVFVLDDSATQRYEIARTRFELLADVLSSLRENKQDIAYFVHEMRRTKDDYELQLIEKAVAITTQAQLAAAASISPGLYEYQVRAELEHIFVDLGSRMPAFPSIVAGGRNTTVLHYTELNNCLHDGDLVVVDIGASFGYYAADITRTYPVSGVFTPRQKELYQSVLETQEFIASIARPGMFLSHPHDPDHSLHHQAVAFLRERELDNFFVHGIGHFLGLDVHDVGDVRKPLQPGDVFTIEPGVYSTQEEIGIRIEDDYVITGHGCRCLSENLVKTVQDIEQLLRK